MPLRVVRRPDSPVLWIAGTVRGRRIRESAGTSDHELAEEYRATREAGLYRAAVHGAREPVAVAAAVESYLDHAGPHSPATLARLRRILAALGPRAMLHQVDQQTADRLAQQLLRPGATPATRLREVTTPLRAILAHAARRGWCDPPRLEAPPPPPARTEWLTPAEVDALADAAASHLRPLIVFLAATGARLGEALALEWPDVDLAHARARLRRTKNGADRQLDLCPRAAEALAALPHRIGPVFRTPSGRPYAPRHQQGGGQIKTALAATLRRAAPACPTLAHAARRLTPHTLRHTWATWHDATHHDPSLLRHAGGWSSLAMVQRYAHLAPRTLAPAIAAWRGGAPAPLAQSRHTPTPDAKIAC